MIKATIKLVLDGRAMSNGQYPIYLRIIKDRTSKRISIGLQCQKENFEGESLTKKHPNYELENEILLNIKSKALKIIREYQVEQYDFTLDEFEAVFRGIENNSERNVIDFYKEIIEELKASGTISTAKAYKDTMVSLNKFKENGFNFNEITPKFLDKYEVFLRKTGSQNGGISFRLRNLRALFNKARKRKLIPKEPYPFEDYNISRLKSTSNKVRLTAKELRRIKDLDLTNYPNLQDTYRYFLFSVYTRGMNFHDMMHLKWDNIQNGRIYYIRSKNKRRLNLEIIQPAQEILDYYEKHNQLTRYVFPILTNEGLTPQQIANRKHKVSRLYNIRLKELSRLAGIDKRITSYVARHTFATVLKDSGSSIEKISEMMGHSNVSITKTYLEEFSNEDLDKENRKFLDI